MKPSEFLTALWGETPRAPVLVWTLPDRRSHWLTSPEEADQDWGERDVYTSVSLPHPDAETPPTRRVSAAEAHAIPGLWADVDYTDEAHTKPGLPAQADALRVLMQDVETPTILVSSGHGYQPWWLFDEPWVFESNDERAQAQMLVRWWQTKLAAALNATMDSTHDLARVLRVPGTKNRKREPHVEVTAEVTGARRTRDLWTLEAESAPGGSGKKAQSGFTFEARTGTGGLVLTADMEPSSTMLERLKKKFPEVTKRLRHEGLKEDPSASGYDMSLAVYAVLAGWQDQDVVALCVLGRRENDEDLKLDRLDYWERTLHKARDGRADPVDKINEQPLYELGDLGMRRILQIRDPDQPDTPTYRIISDHGVLELPNVSYISQNRNFKDACINGIGKLPPTMKGEVWDAFVSRMIEHFEVIEPGHPDHPRSKNEPDETREWVDAYLHGSAPSPTAEEGDMLGCPFEHEGALHFPIFGFRLWLKTARGEQITKERLGRRLRDIGAENVRITVGGRRAHFWTPTG